MKTRKGIYYFETYSAALDYAQVNELPDDRIICYSIGWAIQLYKSGPYAGPV